MTLATPSELIRLQQAVTMTLSQASSPDEAMERVLSALGEALGWPIAAVWQVDESTGTLMWQHVRLEPDIQAPTFTSESWDMQLRPGEGLPGRVWSSRQPVWIPDIQQEARFLRTVAATSAGLHTALGVPIQSGPAFLGVLEFFRREITPPDPDLITVMGLLGMQLGSFLHQSATEAALRQSETRYRQLFEQSPISTQIFAPDGRCLQVNAAWERLWQSRAEDTATYNILTDPQAIALGVPERILPAFDHGDALTMPMISYDPARSGKSGRQRWLQGHLYALKDAAGHVQQVVLFHEDLTDRVQAEAAMLDQQHWLEAVLNLMPTPLVLIAPDSGEATFANQAADRLAGGQFPMGKPVVDFAATFQSTDETGQPIPPDALPAIRAIRGECVTGFPLTWHGPDGVRSLLIDTERLPAMHGHGDTVVMALLDVTDLKAVEAQLRQALSIRDTFLSIASHELKTPLTALLLQAESLLRQRGGEPLPPRLAAKLQAIRRQAERLNTLMTELLEVSRLSAGRLDLDPEPTDLVQVAREVIERFHEPLRHSGSTLRINLVEAAVGCWDRSRVEQILTNLLSNALKFGEGKPIDLTIERQDGMAVLSVRDHGIGIAAADKERLFERFARLVSARQFGGFGLGLWIVKQIVEAMGGTITVDSAPGCGSTFRVQLPIGAVPDA
jgi:signal transduction histidine kinase